MNLQLILTTMKQFLKELADDRATGLAAEQAFYYMLSLFPMAILLLSTLSYFSIDQSEALTFIYSLLPIETARFVEATIMSIVTDAHGGLLTFGIIGTIWSASTGINAFIRAMNEAYNVENSRPFWQARILSIGLTFGLIISFLLIFLLFIFGAVLLRTITNYFFLPSETEQLIQIVRWIATILIMISLLSCMYYLAPNKKIRFRDVLPGAIAATVMWQIVSYGFSFYVSNFGNYSSTYGSLGAVIVLMMWLFLTGLALVTGGKVNAFILEYKKHSTLK